MSKLQKHQELNNPLQNSRQYDKPYNNYMKSHLIKFKTDLDVHANYNRKGLEDAQKEVYSAEIDFTNKVQTLTEKSFTLKPLEIGFLQSLVLKDDPKFKEIQKIYAKYNADIQAEGQRSVNGLHLKTVVMDSMLKFLRMMMLAPDAYSKKTILDISYYWFIKHLNPKSQKKPKEAMLKEIKQLVSEHKLLPKQIIDRQIPSEKQKNQLYEYRMKARTCYTDFDAPSYELQNYHTHKVAYMNEKNDKLEEDDEDRKRKRLMRIIFKKPNLQQYYVLPQQIKQPQKQQEQVKNQPLAIIPQEGEVKPLEGQAQIVSAEQNAQMEMLNQMGGQPDEPQQALPQQDLDVKRGKLDPFVKVFLMKQQHQKEQKLKNQSFQYPPVNHFQRSMQNYKQKILREDENTQHYMNEWAAKRSRFKTQLNRKIQSTRAFNNNIGKELPKVQEAMYKTKINEAIRDGRSYIKGELVRQPLNTQVGLSCFDRKRAKTVNSASNKPFETILEQNKRINKRQQLLDEIEDIKLKFAKQKIFTSYNAMKKGLMHPEEQEEKLQKVQYPTSLLSNPFFVVKKKKKKGKKKK